MRTTSQFSWGSRLMMVPVPSVCPWTRWPPRRSARRTERSRLTLVSGATDLRLEWRRVSPITSAVNPCGVRSGSSRAVPAGTAREAISPVTVRQTPFTQIESPTRASSATTVLRTWIRAKSPRYSTASTSPRSSTMPVNNRVLLRSTSGGRDCWPVTAVPLRGGMVQRHQARPASAGRARAASHPDFNRRSRSSTGSTSRMVRPGRGLSPPVRSFTDPGARLLPPTSVPHEVFLPTAARR